MCEDSKIIMKEVAEYPIVMFTKNNCPYCTKAKNELDEDGIVFVEKNLSEKQYSDPYNYESYVKGLIDLTHQKTVPQIFVCSRFIGGYDEMRSIRADLPNMVKQYSLGQKIINDNVFSKL